MLLTLLIGMRLQTVDTLLVSWKWVGSARIGDISVLDSGEEKLQVAQRIELRDTCAFHIDSSCHTIAGVC